MELAGTTKRLFREVCKGACSCIKKCPQQDLELRADTQWQEIQRMHDERRLHISVQATLLEVLSSFPDLPGAPLIADSVASSIGWTQAP